MNRCRNYRCDGSGCSSDHRRSSGARPLRGRALRVRPRPVRPQRHRRRHRQIVVVAVQAQVVRTGYQAVHGPGCTRGSVCGPLNTGNHSVSTDFPETNWSSHRRDFNDTRVAS